MRQSSVFTAMQAMREILTNCFAFRISSAEFHQCKALKRLARALAKAQDQLNLVEKQYSLKVRALEPHKNRILLLIHRNVRVIEYFEADDDEQAVSNSKLARARGEELHDGLRNLDEELEAMIELKAKAAERVAKIVEKIIRRIGTDRAATESQVEYEEADLFSASILLPSRLDYFEAECAAFDEFLVAEAEIQCEEEALDPTAGVEEAVSDDDAMENMKEEFMQLKYQKQELESRANGDQNEAEVASLTRRICEVGDQLAVRGFPIRNGEYVATEIEMDREPRWQQEDGYQGLEMPQIEALVLQD